MHCFPGILSYDFSFFKVSLICTLKMLLRGNLQKLDVFHFTLSSVLHLHFILFILSKELVQCAFCRKVKILSLHYVFKWLAAIFTVSHGVL